MHEARLTCQGYVTEAVSYGFTPGLLISSKLDSLDAGQVRNAIQRLYAEHDVLRQSFELVLVIQEYDFPNRDANVCESSLSSGFEHILLSRMAPTAKLLPSGLYFINHDQLH